MEEHAKVAAALAWLVRWYDLPFLPSLHGMVGCFDQGTLGSAPPWQRSFAQI